MYVYCMDVYSISPTLELNRGTYRIKTILLMQIVNANEKSYTCNMHIDHACIFSHNVPYKFACMYTLCAIDFLCICAAMPIALK